MISQGLKVRFLKVLISLIYIKEVVCFDWCCYKMLICTRCFFQYVASKYLGRHSCYPRSRDENLIQCKSVKGGKTFTTYNNIITQKHNKNNIWRAQTQGTKHTLHSQQNELKWIRTVIYNGGNEFYSEVFEKFSMVATK